MSQTVRVYVNGRGVDIAASARAVDAVRLMDPGEAEAIEAGGRALADSRALPVDASSQVYAGAIYRTVSARPGAAG